MYLPAFHRQFQAINRQSIQLASQRQLLARYQRPLQAANHLLFQQFSRRYNRVVGHRGSLHFNQPASLQILLQYSQLEGQPELQALSLPASLLAFRPINPRYSRRLCLVVIRPLSQAISLPLIQAHSPLVTRQLSRQETRVVNRLHSRLVNHHCSPLPFRPIAHQLGRRFSQPYTPQINLARAQACNRHVSRAVSLRVNLQSSRHINLLRNRPCSQLISHRDNQAANLRTNLAVSRPCNRRVNQLTYLR
jgi:hypothetical protein